MIHHHASIKKQAWPIYITSLSSMSFAVLDTVMLGHFSPGALQAMAVANSIFITVYLTQLGLIEALIPICSQLFGKRDFDQIAHYTIQGFWFALAFTILGSIIFLHPAFILKLTGHYLPPPVVQDIKTYLAINCIGLLAGNLFRVYNALCTALQQAKIIMQINVIGVIFKAIFNYILIFGINPLLPPLGSSGAALSSALVGWIMFAISVWVVRQNPFYQQLHFTTWKPNWQAQKTMLRLGIPIGFSYLIEISSFTFMALLATHEGTIVSGAHQIMANIVGIMYMLPVALGIATCSVVAYYIGAEQPKQVKKVCFQGITYALVGAVIQIILLLLLKKPLLALYTSDAQIFAIAASLVALAPIFHLVDSLQCIMVNILRGFKIAVAPFVMQTLFLFILGLCGGWYLGYYSHGNRLVDWIHALMPHTPHGVASLWLMSSLAIGICGISLFLWFLYVIKRYLHTYNPKNN